MENLCEIAKQVCKELGIEWDKNATEPTINGKPITKEDWKKLGYTDEESEMLLSASEVYK